MSLVNWIESKLEKNFAKTESSQKLEDEEQVLK